MPEVLLSLGSNYRKDSSIPQGLLLLQSYFPEILLSQVYEFDSVGQAGPSFYNLAAKLETVMPLPNLVKLLKKIESEVGDTLWINGVKYKAFDIDLLCYGDLITELPVCLPRKGFEQFHFILRPLLDVAQHDIHPVAQQSYLQLYHALASELPFSTVDL